MRVTGVPFIMFEKDKDVLEALSGAQPPEAFIEILSANL
jgi:predicted DsbA family dithiol-disulfide isomerase